MKRWQMIVAAAMLATAGSVASAEDKPAAPPPSDKDKAPPPTDKAPPPSDKTEAAWKKGDKVDVEFRGKWYKAVILDAWPKNEFKIHYIGFREAWDEVVPVDRIRARTADSGRGKETDEKE